MAVRVSIGRVRRRGGCFGPGVVGGRWRCNNDDVFWAHGALAVLDRFARGGPQGRQMIPVENGLEIQG